jgi:chemotaxis protein CheD
MKMPCSQNAAEIFLLPGEIFFAAANNRIHTVLGSCVSISLWHPALRLGGMCHFMLPSRGERSGKGLDGRYADEAIQLLLHEIGKTQTRPAAYQVKVFGGGNMFHAFQEGKAMDVARANIQAARDLLNQCGFQIHAEDVGGNGHRRIIFDLCDGNVWVRHERTALATAPGKRKKAPVSP